MSYVELKVGRMSWSHIRHYFERHRLLNPDCELRWVESPGWIERTFTVTCNAFKYPSCLPQIKRDFRPWVRNYELDANAQ